MGSASLSCLAIAVLHDHSHVHCQRMLTLWSTCALPTGLPELNQANVHHGQVVGDVWINNVFEGQGPDWGSVPPDGPNVNTNVSIFVPE